MTIGEIAAELAETLAAIRRRADVCQQHAKDASDDGYIEAANRLLAKATAYGHVAELLDEVLDRCGLRKDGQP